MSTATPATTAPSAAEALTAATEVLETTPVLREFWSHIVTVWTTPVLDFTAGQLIFAAVIVAMGWLLRGLMAKTLLHVAHDWVAKRETKLGNDILVAIEGPAKLVPLVIALFIAILVLDLSPSGKATAENALQSLIAVIIFWGLRNAVGPIAQIATPLRRTLSPEIVDWLFQGLRIFALLLGGAVVLQIWGIPVAPLIAGFGIFGVAVALGAQDFFKNVIAGMSILLEKRFSKGDWVLVEGVVEGTVERIGFRSTHIRRFDKSPVYIPNTALSDNAVTNFSRMSHRRIYWKLGLEYRTSAAQLTHIRQEIEDYIAGNDDFAQSPEVTTFVRIDSFNASSIDIVLYAFTKTTNWVEWLDIKQDLLLAIKRIVEDAGSAFAFPSTTLYLEQGEEPPQFFPKTRPTIAEHPAKSKTATAQG